MTMAAKENINKEYVVELTKMVRNLMYFIVKEGKSCVDQKHRKLYVSTYLMLFVKVMNQSAEPLDQVTIQKEILSDTEWLNNIEID